MLGAEGLQLLARVALALLSRGPVLLAEPIRAGRVRDRSIRTPIKPKTAPKKQGLFGQVYERDSWSLKSCEP